MVLFAWGKDIVFPFRVVAKLGHLEKKNSKRDVSGEITRSFDGVIEKEVMRIGT